MGIKFNGITIVLLLVLSLSFAGCKKDSMGSPGTNEVWMQNTVFNPATITVAANTTITWTNKDNMTHTVTSDASLFNSGNINNGGTFMHQLTTAGTFSYHCSIHAGMTGKVVVQ